jgi:predicted nucleotide-binding protein
VGDANDAATRSVASFVQQLGLEAAPLAAGAAGGDSTFLDRLEGVRGADYAIVLMPAADLAPAPGGAGLRPQTLMEIGFLFGLLSRRKVCFLVSGKAALAPELEGLVQVHTRDEAELWRLLLAREMRKAGIEVDMNKAV